MKQTLKCDPRTSADKYDCGEWDYIWDALIFIPVNDTVEAYKLGSLLRHMGKGLKWERKRLGMGIRLDRLCATFTR